MGAAATTAEEAAAAAAISLKCNDCRYATVACALKAGVKETETATLVSGDAHSGDKVAVCACSNTGMTCMENKLKEASCKRDVAVILTIDMATKAMTKSSCARTAATASAGERASAPLALVGLLAALLLP